MRLQEDSVTSPRGQRFLLCFPLVHPKKRTLYSWSPTVYRNSLNGLFMVSKRNTSGAVLLVRWKWAWHADGGRPARWECPIACRTHWPPPDVARFLLASEGFFWDACDPGLHTLVPSSAVHREALCCCCLLSSMFLLLPFVESHPLPRAPRAAEELLESGLSSGPLLLGTVGGGGCCGTLETVIGSDLQIPSLHPPSPASALPQKYFRESPAAARTVDQPDFCSV